MAGIRRTTNSIPTPMPTSRNTSVNRLHDAHLQEMVKRADAAVKLNREKILSDAAARSYIEMGEVPLDSEMLTRFGPDIDPVRGENLGSASPRTTRREPKSARRRGRGEDRGRALQAAMTDAARKAAIQNGETARLVRDASNCYATGSGPEAGASDRRCETGPRPDETRQEAKLPSARRASPEADRRVARGAQGLHRGGG